MLCTLEAVYAAAFTCSSIERRDGLVNMFYIFGLQRAAMEGGKGGKDGNSGKKWKGYKRGVLESEIDDRVLKPWEEEYKRRMGEER